MSPVGSASVSKTLEQNDYSGKPPSHKKPQIPLAPRDKNERMSYAERKQRTNASGGGSVRPIPSKAVPTRVGPRAGSVGNRAQSSNDRKQPLRELPGQIPNALNTHSHHADSASLFNLHGGSDLKPPVVELSPQIPIPRKQSVTGANRTQNQPGTQSAPTMQGMDPNAIQQQLAMMQQ